MNAQILDRLYEAIGGVLDAAYDAESVLRQVAQFHDSQQDQACATCGHPERWHEADRALCRADMCRCPRRRGQAA